MDIQAGAKIVANLKSENIINKEEAERLIAFTNNSGPLFILGTVGVSLLNNQRLGYILLISHILSCLLVGIIFRNWKKQRTSSKVIENDIKRVSKNIGIKDFGEILGKSIRNSIITIVNICGFIVIFSVIISILNSCRFFYITGVIFEYLNIPKTIR